MPLVSADLATVISNQILEQQYTPAPVNGVVQPAKPFSSLFTDTEWMNSFCLALATAIVTYIQQNADVTITVANHIHTGGTLLDGVTGPPVPGPEAIETGEHLTTGGIK